MVSGAFEVFQRKRVPRGCYITRGDSNVDSGHRSSWNQDRRGIENNAQLYYTSRSFTMARAQLSFETFPGLTPASFLSLISCFVLWFNGIDAAAIGPYPYDSLSSILGNEKWSPNTTITFAGTPEFSEVTERWTTFNSPTYRAAISPDTEEDVVKIVSGKPSKQSPRVQSLRVS